LSGDDQPDDDAANLGTVTAYDPPHVLEFTFTVTGPASHGEQHVLRWELASTSDGCILMLCNAFAPGERARNSIVCGWHHGVDNLETYLAGGTIVWDDARARLEALYWHYRRLPRG
jgi:uncharacterized protein YndB with AHSA1/START domain